MLIWPKKVEHYKICFHFLFSYIKKCHKAPNLLGDVDIKKIVSKKVSFGEKARSTLFVTCMIITKLSHCI